MQNSLFRHLHGAFFIFCGFFAAALPKADADYTFTNIADTVGPFSFLGIRPSINASGTVAFGGNLDNGSYGIFKGDGITTTTIFSSTVRFGGVGLATINQAGTVAFTTLNALGSAVFTGNGGPLVTIADTNGPLSSFGGYTAINAAGTVAFTASRNPPPGGIFVSNGGTPTRIAGGVPGSINDAGTVSFSGGLDGRRIVGTSDGGPTTVIADSSGPIKVFNDTPSINQAGTVAFIGGIGDLDDGAYGIYSGNGGPLTTIADLSGPFSYFSLISAASINGLGAVAFTAALDAGGVGLFVGDGTFINEVIGFGDALFGSTLRDFNITPTSFNDSGQIAFYYELANGATGIALATPVPEPSSALLLTALFGVGLFRRFR